MGAVSSGFKREAIPFKNHDAQSLIRWIHVPHPGDLRCTWLSKDPWPCTAKDIESPFGGGSLQIQNTSAGEGALQYGSFFGRSSEEDYVMEGVPPDDAMTTWSEGTCHRPHDSVVRPATA